MPKRNSDTTSSGPVKLHATKRTANNVRYEGVKSGKVITLYVDVPEGMTYRDELTVIINIQPIANSPEQLNAL